jgi:drug/metabolite transporter (DMT)-like permease
LPVVAVALGYFAAGEIVTVRSVVASILVVASVCLILTRSASHAPRGDAARREIISADLSN